MYIWAWQLVSWPEIYEEGYWVDDKDWNGHVEHLASYSQYVIDTHDGSESQVQFTHSFSLSSTFMYICADWDIQHKSWEEGKSLISCGRSFCVWNVTVSYWTFGSITSSYHTMHGAILSTRNLLQEEVTCGIVTSTKMSSWYMNVHQRGKSPYVSVHTLQIS